MTPVLESDKTPESLLDPQLERAQGCGRFDLLISLVGDRFVPSSDDEEVGIEALGRKIMENFARSICRQCAWTLLAALVLLSLPMVAQETVGRVIGVVTDPSGSVIPRAKVTVTNVDTGANSETTTGSDGSYQVLQLQVGSYRVSAEAQGFRKSVTSVQKLEINQSLKIDVKLEVGTTNETVQVEANASGVETVVATLGSVVSGSQISEAPLDGRNVFDLATLLPGVIPSQDGGSHAHFNVAGGRGDSVTYLLDGAMNNDLLSNDYVANPNPDAVEEFRILTSNYNAEYGRNGAESSAWSPRAARTSSTACCSTTFVTTTSMPIRSSTTSRIFRKTS